ncbi:hypothetical protein QMK19_28275 [Streptomyces sp. H10-C2]|uniref:hypothetical protein n=1 Tax=unclassified Streptomyces TaxID=2593676 RepID=UPI0024B88150|nr:MULTISPECIES: hypothetical protein [unclassified Streptomyces]MDJ0343855.1 hypothetical protein [Streptomyces sp. PH10-H1]MDJ0373444.1 hypothetical protein [Streptomyces sp. H10-C2]
MTETAEQTALVEEATKKSGLVWVQAPTGRPPQAVWHAWVDGAMYVLGGGPGEQPLGGLADGGTAVVTVRSKDKGGRLVAWPAAVTALAPDSEEWTAAVEELKGKRLNAPDAETMTVRWARECQVLRLAPSGPLAEQPGDMPDDSGAASPVPTPATTRQPMPEALPRLLARRRKRA